MICHKIFSNYKHSIKLNPERTDKEQFLYERLIDISPNGNYVGDVLVRLEWTWDA